eukprot:8657341-Alexandrium_andersonii.AAC.1
MECTRAQHTTRRPHSLCEQERVGLGPLHLTAREPPPPRVALVGPLRGSVDSCNCAGNHEKQ